MVEVDLPSLNRCYARRRSWYPSVPMTGRKVQAIAGLSSVLDQFDLILLDAYGVLCCQGEAVTGALDALALLRQKGKACCVVSNDTLSDGEQAARKYAACGFDLTVDEVVTSLDVTLSWLPSIGDRARWGLVAPESHCQYEPLKDMVHLNACEGHIPPEVDSLLFLSAGGWTREYQENLVASVQERQFSLVVGNPDVAAPSRRNGEDWLYATPGYFLDDMVTRTGQQGRPVLLGKPGRRIFEAACHRYGPVSAERVLMVGDTLYTDVLGGAAMGFSTLLLESGIYKSVGVESAVAEAGIVPDFVAPHL